MSEGVVGGVASITDLKALRSRIIGKTKVGRPVTGIDSLIETLKGEDFAAQVKVVVPTGVEFNVDRFVQTVLRALEEDERLVACDPRSVLGCALRCAEIGLMVGGVMQHAFLVPRGRRDGRGGFLYEAEVSVGYRGMIALAMRSGKVKSITSRLVYEKEIEEDRFDLYFEGEKDVMIHRPVLYGDKGEAVMVYCLVRFTDGTFHVEPMGKDEIEKIKEGAVQRWSGLEGESPWITNEMEMWRKTPVRRAFKYLNVQVEGLDRAIRMEEEGERGQRQDLARLIEAGFAEEPANTAPPVAEAATVKDSAQEGKVQAAGEVGAGALAEGGGGGSLKGTGEVAEGKVEAAVGTGPSNASEAGGTDDGERAKLKGAEEALSAAPQRASVERPAKYRDPNSGATWNGWGKAPHWMPREKSERDAFLIDKPDAGVGPGEVEGGPKKEKEAGVGTEGEANPMGAGATASSETDGAAGGHQGELLPAQETSGSSDNAGEFQEPQAESSRNETVPGQGEHEPAQASLEETVDSRARSLIAMVMGAGTLEVSGAKADALAEGQDCATGGEGAPARAAETGEEGEVRGLSAGVTTEDS